MTTKCITCHGTGKFYAATESVWQGWQAGYNHTYTLQPCPCTPRVVQARAVRDVSARQGGGRREAIPFDGLLTRKEGKP